MNPFIENENVNECEICESFGEFVELVQAGVPVHEAYHTVVESLLENAVEQSYDIGLKRGFADSFENLSDILGVFGQALNNEVDEELEV